MPHNYTVDILFLTINVQKGKPDFNMVNTSKQAWISLQATANSQLTINPKDREHAFSGIPTHINQYLLGFN